MDMTKHHATVAETVIGYVLRGGLFLSILITFYGAVLFFSTGEHADMQFSTFHYPPREMIEIRSIVKSALHNDPECIIQIGLLIMIATPFLRVLSCLIIFLFQKDYLYVMLAFIVLSILGHSIFTI